MFKKVVMIIAILLSLVISYGKVAYAEGETWARVIKDGVYLYTTADTNQQLFLLEKSYYVNVVYETEDMYQVAVMPQGSTEFVQVIGWVIKGEVTISSAPLEPVYPTEMLTVTADSVELKLSPTPSAQASCAVLNLQRVYYYGKINSYGKVWYYVRYAGRFGYLDASCVSQPNISLHPTPLPSTPASTVPQTPPSSDDVTDPPKSSSPTSEILLIAFVVLLAVGLTLALFLPGNVKKKSNVFEQDI
ncbi:MAG: hypothetical protein J1G02_00535 [Clostridiales bacterium]|nr:hypothetical protein [Clostridiales bacterium]